MKKPGIPMPPRAPDRAHAQFDNAVRETLEIITGARNTRIKTLPPDASLSDVIDKVNEILDLLQ